MVVASVVSCLGSWRSFFGAIAAVAERVGEDANDRVLRTGDLRHVVGESEGHICQMFRWTEIAALVDRTGGRLLGASASNWASLGDAEALARLEADDERWRRFIEHEVAACAEPGALDGGTHFLFAARRREPADGAASGRR